MSTKEGKPSLAGVQIKTRKRNIAVAHDPGSFANAVIDCFKDAKEGTDVEKNLQAGLKDLESTDLDFSRYGESLFEVLFAGGRLAGGGNVVEEGKKLDDNVLASEPTREGINPYVKIFQALLRKRPFLVRPLENTLINLLRSLDFHNETGRVKIAIAAARCFAWKLGLQPDRVLLAVMDDRVISKGLVLHWITAFFQDYLATESLDDLVALLKKARLDSRLMDLFPPHKRTLDDFDQHFKAVGLTSIVEYNKKQVTAVQVEELKTALTEAITSDPPKAVEEVDELIVLKKKNQQLPDAEIIKTIWSVVISAVPTVGKNNQQILGAMTKQIKHFKLLFDKYCSTARLEAALMVHVQVFCYEDSKLLKLFSSIIRFLYDSEIIGEDTVRWWYKKGSHPKGRQVFQRDLEPFIKWLEEAEEEEEEEE